MSIPTTDQLKAGYYDLTYTADVAQHAFCRASHVNFECYGGINGTNLVYPAHLYEQAMILPKDMGTSAPANLQFAMGMAQFSSEPEIKSDYNAHSGGYLDLGDCSGLIYGVTGVCHQMCNRILMADTHGGKDWGGKPVNWPPSLYASFWLYGFVGLESISLISLDIFANNLYNTIANGASSMKTEEIERKSLESLTSIIDEKYFLDSRNRVVDKRLVDFEQHTNTELSGNIRQIIINNDQSLIMDFRNACLNLFTGGYDPSDFANYVNQALHAFFTNIKQQCPGTVFNWITGGNINAPISPQDIAVVIPDYMATAEQYKSIGIRLYEYYQKK